MNHHSQNVQVFLKIICSFGAFFEKSPYEAIFSYFFSQSFTKSKSQDTLIFSLLAGSGNCWKMIDFTKRGVQFTEKAPETVTSDALAKVRAIEANKNLLFVRIQGAIYLFLTKKCGLGRITRSICY